MYHQFIVRSFAEGLLLGILDTFPQEVLVHVASILHTWLSFLFLILKICLIDLR